MYWLHEVHSVVGAREDEFERVFREEWAPRIAEGGPARLLYFLHHAHGSGASYRVVTVTAVPDGAAWGDLSARVDRGDLADCARRLDGLRHDVVAKLLVPLPWSPIQQLDPGEVALEVEPHDPTVFMEDTVWPHEGELERYVERSGEHYAAEMREQDEKGHALLRVQASFRTAFGSGRRREIVLWQKLVRPEFLGALLTREVPERYKVPGKWMHDALSLRDQWESRLLRSARWSPWS